MEPSSRISHITSLLSQCTPSELRLISSLIAPLLKRDFLSELPTELALQIVAYVDEPKTVGRMKGVSKRWKEVVSGQVVWRRLARRYKFETEELIGDEDVEMAFIKNYITFKNWKRGGRPISSHTIPRDRHQVQMLPIDLPTCLALSLAHIVLAFSSGKIHVYSTSSGVLCRTLLGHDKGVWALAVVEAGGGGVQTAESGSDPPNRPPAMMSDPNFTSQGWGQPYDLLVSAGCTKLMLIHNLSTGQQLFSLSGHTATIRSLRITHHYPFLISGSRSGVILVHNLETRTLSHISHGHHASIRALDVHGRKYVSGSYDGTARLWDIDSESGNGGEECEMVFRGHLHAIYAVCFDKTGDIVATGGLDTTVRVWGVVTGECKAILQSHTSLVIHLNFSPTNAYLVSADSSGRLSRVRLSSLSNDPYDHDYTARKFSAHESSITAIQHLNGFPNLLISAGNEGCVNLWEMDEDGEDGAKMKKVRILATRAESVYKVACTVRGKGKGAKESHGSGSGDVCVIVCRRAGRVALEMWSYAPDVHVG